MTEEVRVKEGVVDGDPIKYVWYTESRGCVYVKDGQGTIWRQEFVVTEEEKTFDDEDDFWDWWDESSLNFELNGKG